MNAQTTFELYFQQYYRPLCVYAFRLIKDRETSKDIVQDVFESVWCRMQHITSDTISPYLYTNVHNRCIDIMRKRDYYILYFQSIVNSMEEKADYIREDEENDDLVHLKRHIAQLPCKTRHILTECVLHEKKYKEVALQEGISIGMVNKYICKALRMLREECR